MTKQQAIRKLGELGWTFIRNDGKFSVVFNPPINEVYHLNWVAWASQKREVVADPRDLLEEVQLYNAVHGI